VSLFNVIASEDWSERGNPSKLWQRHLQSTSAVTIYYRKGTNLGILITIIVIIFVILLAIYLYWGNNNIMTTAYKYSSPKIPKEFDYFRIVQVSDLHNKKLKTLIDKISECKPNIILITGDLIDRNCKALMPVVRIVRKMLKIAPVYYVTGNHEADNGLYKKLKQELIEVGAVVLDGQKVHLGKGFSLVGLEDFDLNPHTYSALSKLSNPHDFQILLAHRPEPFETYAKAGMDLIFSGHAHGGQIRLPFIGGIYSPDQGFFPKLAYGEYIANSHSNMTENQKSKANLHTVYNKKILDNKNVNEIKDCKKDGSTLIVSRGLGNTSRFPIRLFNRPELVLVELNSE